MIKYCACKGKKADAPVKSEHTEEKYNGIDKTAEDIDKHHRPVALHYVEYSGGDPGDLAKAPGIKIPHRNPFQFITDGNSFICNHEVSSVGLLKLGEAVDDGSPGYAGNE